VFNFRIKALLVAGLIGIGSQAADASIMYDLTLTPTSGGSISGSGTFTISSTPQTGFHQISDYFETPNSTSGSLLDFSITIGGDTFTFAQQSSQARNPPFRLIAAEWRITLTPIRPDL
jgi:hypothetical protein